MTLGGASFAHAGGSAAGTYRWRWDDADAIGAAVFTPTAAQLTIGHHTLVLLLDDQPVRRVDLQVWGNEGLLVGCQTGVFAIDSGAPATVIAVDPVEVTGTYELGPWHFRGERAPTPEAATLSGATVQVAAGSIAEVSTNRPAGSSTITPPPSGYPIPAGQLHFVFDTTNTTRNASDVTQDMGAGPADRHARGGGRSV